MYTLYNDGTVEKDGFPISSNIFDPEHVAYLAWIEAGNTPIFKDASEYKTVDTINRDAIKAEYLNTINTLQQIEDATSPTNAQVVAAVKFLARTVRLILKIFVRRML